MRVKETIAVIGHPLSDDTQLIGSLAGKGHPIVLVSKHEDETKKSIRDVKRAFPKADISAASCEREGCWESDIILLPLSTRPDKELAEKIKTVSNQKIIVFLSSEKSDAPAPASDSEGFCKILSHSKWVQAHLVADEKKFRLKGDESSVGIVADLLINAGYVSEVM